MSSNPTHTSQEQLHSLEARRLLAGDLTVSVVGNDLVVEGDADNNGVYVTEQRVGPNGRIVDAGGVTNIDLDFSTLQAQANLTNNGSTGGVTPDTDYDVAFSQVAGSTLTFDTGDADYIAGSIRHTGTVDFTIPDGPDAGTDPDDLSVGDFEVAYLPGRVGLDLGGGNASSGFVVIDRFSDLGILFDVPQTGTTLNGTATEYDIGGTASGSVGGANLLVSPEFAQLLLDLGLATNDLTGANVGDVRSDADATTVNDLYRIVGVEDTTVGGFVDEVVPTSGINNVELDMLDGDDTLLASSIRTFGFLEFAGGDGTDSAQLFDAVPGSATIFSSTGTIAGDQINAVMGDVLTGGIIFNGSSGADSLLAVDTDVTAAVRIDFGPGDDTLTGVNFSSNTINLAGVTFLRGGAGTDTLDLDGDSSLGSDERAAEIDSIETTV